MYLLKLSFRPWRIAPLSQICSAIAVGFLLLLLGFLFWMQKGLRPVLTRLQGEQVITAYIDTSVSSSDEEQLVDRIRTSLGSQGMVSGSPEVKVMTASAFVKLIKNQYPDLGHELEDLGQEMKQVIPRYISVTGILPASALEKIEAVPGIESAENSKDRYTHVVTAFRALRWVVRILMLGICMALLTGLIHLSRMNAYLHKDALVLLRFWGASKITLISPEVISGLVVGLLGGLLAGCGWITIGTGLTHHIRSLSLMLREMPAVHSDLAITLLLIGGVVGFLAGFLGSLSSSQLNPEGSVGA